MGIFGKSFHQKVQEAVAAFGLAAATGLNAYLPYCRKRYPGRSGIAYFFFGVAR